MKSFPSRLIAFKPHPILKPKLYKHALWGKERTDAYYHCWETMENTQLEMSDYIDLFMTSDAMIFDSVSFMTEYLYTKKPALFLCREGIEKQSVIYFYISLQLQAYNLNIAKK